MLNTYVKTMLNTYVVALCSCQDDVTHQYKQIRNGGTETM